MTSSPSAVRAVWAQTCQAHSSGKILRGANAAELPLSNPRNLSFFQPKTAKGDWYNDSTNDSLPR